MNEYASNSHKSKEATPEKKIEKAISGTAKVKKKSEMAKLTDVFISEDVNNVKSYILMDVLVPAVKKAITDIVKNGIDMIFYGGDGSSSSKTPSSKVSYRSYYDTGNSRTNREVSRVRTGYGYDDVSLDTRGEAENVVVLMQEIIEKYGTVSVADMYDLCGVTCSHTDYKYGWSEIGIPPISRGRDGRYVIKLPKALPID